MQSYRHDINSKPKMTATLEFVTPELAASYLEKNFLNRPLVKTFLSRLVGDIKSQNYMPNHQGVAFDEAGALIDGQHRLNAITISGISLWMFVVRNVPCKSRISVDTGKSRTTAHCLVMDGFPCTQKETHVAKFILGHPSGTPHFVASTNSQVKEFLIKHRDAIAFATKHSRLTVPVAAAICRAWYHRDHQMLSRFSGIVSDEIQSGDPAESAAVALRKFLSTPAGKANGAVLRYDVFCRAEYCIDRFADKMVTGKTFAISCELFPLPEEQSSDKE